MTELGPVNVILGLLWLKSDNSEINWVEGIVKMDSNVKKKRMRVEQVTVSTQQ